MGKKSNRNVKNANETTKVNFNRKSNGNFRADLASEVANGSLSMAEIKCRTYEQLAAKYSLQGVKVEPVKHNDYENYMKEHAVEEKFPNRFAEAEDELNK